VNSNKILTNVLHVTLVITSVALYTSNTLQCNGTMLISLRMKKEQI
jgi:hypothetical protein